MKPSLRRVWHVARWPLGVLGVAYIVLVIYRAWAIGEEEKTQQAVARIHAQRITLADVMGENLPPLPNPQENNATIEGVDVNNNGIRDDVELAIFEKYPDSPRVRAGQLQYALALQMELTEVFNSETLVATIQEVSRGNFCIADLTPKLKSSPTSSELKEVFSLIDKRVADVESLVFNSELRKQKKEENFKYATSHGDVGGPNCDIDPASLP